MNQTRPINSARKEDFLQSVSLQLSIIEWATGLELKEIRPAKEWRGNKARKFRVLSNNGVLWFSDFSADDKPRDIFTLAAENYGISVFREFGEVLSRLSRDFNISSTQAGLDWKAQRQTPRPLVAAAPYKPNLAGPTKTTYSQQIAADRSALYAFFAKWSVSPKTVDRFKWENLASMTKTQTGKITPALPNRPLFAFPSGENVKIRSKKAIWVIDGDPIKTITAAWSGNFVAGYDQLPFNCRAIIIVAGEKDLMVLSELLNPHNIFIIALSHESATLPPALLSDLKNRTDNIAILYDEDKTGLRYSDKISRAFDLVRLRLKGLQERETDVCDLTERAGIESIISAIYYEQKTPFGPPELRPAFGLLYTKNELPLDTIELQWRNSSSAATTPTAAKSAKTAEISSLSWLNDSRRLNKQDVKKLNQIARGAATEDANKTISSIAKKKALCSYFFAGIDLPTSETLKKGQNFCKHKSCHVCSYIVSRERKKAVLGFLEKNSLSFARSHFYHLTLTLQHSETNRAGDYSKELIETFGWLRRSTKTLFYTDDFSEVPRKGNKITTDRKTGIRTDKAGRELEKAEYSNRELWDKFITGGFYSMEVIPARNDSSLHIHLHVLVLSESDLEAEAQSGIDLTQELKKRWKGKTAGSDQLKLERVYYLKDAIAGQAREAREKVYLYPQEAKPQEDAKTHFARMGKALAEALKYSLKMDFSGIEGTTAETLAGLLSPGKRYFNFFGSLRGQGITVYDYKDIKDIKAGKDEVFSPTHGAVFHVNECSYSITKTQNLTQEKINGVEVYSYKEKGERVSVSGNMLLTLSAMTPATYQKRLENAGAANMSLFDGHLPPPSNLEDIAPTPPATPAEIARIYGVDELKYIKLELWLKEGDLSKEEIENFRLKTWFAERAAAEKIENIYVKEIDGPAAEQLSRKFLRAQLKGTLPARADDDRITIDERLLAKIYRLNISMEKASRKFDRIKITAGNFEVLPLVPNKKDIAQGLPVFGSPLPYGCKVLELIGIQLDALDYADRITNPPPPLKKIDPNFVPF